MSGAEIAVIGGSGFYEFLDSPEAVTSTSTPYGEASGPVSTGEVAGRRVAFLPRHGADHALPPHRINYRANLWLLRSLGVRQVLAPCAVGGLRADLVAPGDVVVPDQLVDRTSGRAGSYVERGAVHLPFGDPYCPRLLETFTASPDVHSGGTMVVIDGPRFSTRAESCSYAEQGWSLINMTGAPEAALAREMHLCYAAVALVTDMDAGAEVGGSVRQDDVFAMFAANIERLKTILRTSVSTLPDPAGCSCSSWSTGVELTYDVPGLS
ncbi:MAG: S-methyl-5'-thioadenosine phosphorylase [Marmoricola sp.]